MWDEMILVCYYLQSGNISLPGPGRADNFLASCCELGEINVIGRYRARLKCVGHQHFFNRPFWITESTWAVVAFISWDSYVGDVGDVGGEGGEGGDVGGEMIDARVVSLWVRGGWDWLSKNWDKGRAINLYTDISHYDNHSSLTSNFDRLCFYEFVVILL